MKKHTNIGYQGVYFVILSSVGVLALTNCERIAYYSTGQKETPPATTSTTTGASAGGGSSGTTRTALLQSIAACQLDVLKSFRESAEAFDDAAAKAKTDPMARPDARLAWKNAMDAWQKAEMFQFGPAGPSTTPGGKFFRDSIYSWPLVSRCLVEQNLVSQAYAKPDFGTTALINVRGLAAAEYLLFYEGTDNACSPSTNINASGDWAALGADEIVTRKFHYASAVASGVKTAAITLENAWRADGGNFVEQFLNAGSSASAYTNEQMALNAVSDALFYLEKPLKDLKLAKPLGIMDCEAATCPESVESRYAGRSRTHIRNNLVGFRMILAGCEIGGNTGFDDLLLSKGATDLANKMTTNVDLAIAAADAVPQDDLAMALATNPTSVLNLHAAVKNITDILKTEFVSVLDLETPQTVEGDND